MPVDRTALHQIRDTLQSQLDAVDRMLEQPADLSTDERHALSRIAIDIDAAAERIAMLAPRSAPEPRFIGVDQGADRR